MLRVCLVFFFLFILFPDNGLLCRGGHVPLGDSLATLDVTAYVDSFYHTK